VVNLPDIILQLRIPPPIPNQKMNANTPTPKLARRHFCLWMIAGGVPLLVGNLLRAEQPTPPAKKAPPFDDTSVLCRNPAYRVTTENGQTCLSTTDGKGQRIIFGIDPGGLAVWNALAEVTDIEAKRGRTVAVVRKQVIAAFPKTGEAKTAAGVNAFLKQAVEAGVVLPSNKSLFCRIGKNEKSSK
jgi:hypothetical protein